MIDELVIADERPVGLPPRDAELIFVELLENLALIELDGLVDVVEELTLGDV